MLIGQHASMFLETLIRRSPYTIKAIQVDGGSEFEAGFEEACSEKGIRLYVLPPRSPKLKDLGMQSTVAVSLSAWV